MKKIQAKPWAMFLLLILSISLGMGQPKLIEPQIGSYLPGKTVDPGIFVYDSDGSRVFLKDLFDDSSRVVVLSLLGGAAPEPVSPDHRGNLWCEDSFDDLAVQRALAAWCEGKSVKFIAVAIPNILVTPDGEKENIFLASSDGDDRFRASFRDFVSRTETERVSTVLPFDKVYYDPKGRLMFSREALGELAVGYGEIHDWQGKFKWHLDPRTYGLPTIWILDGAGAVSGEPFWGNDYDSVPPQINYGFEELKAAVEKLLE